MAKTEEKNTQKYEERKMALLKRLEEFFKNDDDVEECSIFTKEELDAPMDVLRVLIPEYGPSLLQVLAEFSFLPLPEQEVWYFNSVITISMDIPKNGVSALANAIARLNFYLPYGSFALNNEGNMLVYKSVAALRTDHSDDKLYEDIELSADTALLIPENQTHLLLAVAVGKLLLDQYIETLPA